MTVRDRERYLVSHLWADVAWVQNVHRQGFNLQLPQYDRGWRATFYTTGMEQRCRSRGSVDRLLVSFGVAPAAITFSAGVNTPLDQVILLFFVGCGVRRLARYNVTAEQLSTQTGRVEYFEGTPIPTSIVPLSVLMLAFYGGTLYRVNLLGVEWHAIALLFLVSGSLMISKTLRIPKP